VQAADDDLLVFTAATLKSPKARKLQNAGVELVQAKLRAGKIDLHAVLKELGRREILSVLLEAGPHLNAAALSAGLVHKLVLFYAPKLAGTQSVPFAHLSNIARHDLRVRSFQQFGPDVAIELILGKLAK
jgi:diaminohydroxyphosphoribosylaminopyrimidine deaminase/5-amino-6-(5-phosphoribosylamino)uracil reductase